MIGMSDFVSEEVGEVICSFPVRTGGKRYNNENKWIRGKEQKAPECNKLTKSARGGSIPS